MGDNLSRVITLLTVTFEQGLLGDEGVRYVEIWGSFQAEGTAGARTKDGRISGVFKESKASRVGMERGGRQHGRRGNDWSRSQGTFAVPGKDFAFYCE